MIKIDKINKKQNPYADLKPFIKKDKKGKQLIIAENLSHFFNSKNKKDFVFENINFDIYENDRLAFLGPNGAGKTTMISILCGYIKQKSGNIKYNFEYKNNPYEKLSVQFQDLQFPSSLTPKDLIEFSLKLSNIDYQTNKKEIDEALNIFEIDKILNKKMSKLSGGQQQRVNVLISLLGKPKVLFLDEFTTGLDIAIKNRIQNYILNYCERNNIALVIISHDIDCIEEMTNRMIILADKKIMIDANSKELIKEFGSVKNVLKKYIIL